MIKLTGLLLVGLGFALRLNPLPVIMLAGITTGLLAGFNFMEVLAMIGSFFVDKRGLTLPVILMVPVVGILERHGLRQQVAVQIGRMRAATAGGVLWSYQFLRGLASVFGLSIGHHVSMVRPLIVPRGGRCGGAWRRPAEGTTRGHPGARGDLDFQCRAYGRVRLPILR